MKKHSVTLHGHRTSISLESEFWEELKSIAGKQEIAVAQLISQIDTLRVEAYQQTNKAQNLSSAIRVYVLNYVKENG